MENKIEIVREKTCGKLYVGGEYAILYENQRAIIKNINIFMEGEGYFAEEYKIFSDMFDYEVDLNYDKNYSLIQETIKMMNDYLVAKGKKIEKFSLKITGKMEKNGKKYGIGSSGSVVVLVIKVMDKLYELDLSREMIFKLAVLVLLKSGDNGSMGDIACISYENLIMFKAFNREKVKKMLEKMEIMEILKREWGYEIEEIKCNVKFDFLVGWTKEVAISREMIKKVKGSIDERFLVETKKSVIKLKNSFEKGEKEKIKELINRIGELLYKLDENILSDKLKQLIFDVENLDAVAKSSGAGGGDCGIALSFDEKSTKEILEKWEKSEIELLYLEKLN